MSSPPASQNGDESLPAWMQSVNEATFYNAKAGPSSDGTGPTQRPQNLRGGHSDRPASGTSDDGGSGLSQARFSETLRLSMEDPSNLPDLDPETQPTPAGPVRADLERQLRKAVAVLQTRYLQGVSKSVVLEFALRSVLVDLWEEKNNSALVQWLDSALPQS